MTDQCLRAITTRVKDQFDGEVIVVDNNSRSPEWQPLKEKWSKFGIQFIESAKNIGFGQGNELGIRQSAGEYVLIMNPDVEVREGAIETMIRYMDTHRDVGIVGPQLIYPNGIVQNSYRAFPIPTDLIIKRSITLGKKHFFENQVREYLMLDKDPNETDEVDWLVGACLLVRRKALDEVGSFDPRFFLFFEDTDLCRRMWMKNWRVIYLPVAKATHHKEERLSGNDILSSLGKKTFWIHIASAMKYFWKWR
ncbi:glycosyltransferase family 2 protein [Candidatus Peregrinibacteria bacterium]|nr:glycosyltransferase family 2 protein [Candidatus Peregrinibacteria bacterium]